MTRRARGPALVAGLVGAVVLASIPLGRSFVAETRAVLSPSPAAGAPAPAVDPTTPILVLGGERERMVLALTLPGVAAGERSLVASAGAADDLVALGGDCDAPGVRCVDPVPATTRGEARLAARLARTEGWDRLVVVTSWWHVHRASLHLAACLEPLGVAVTLVPAGDPAVRPGPLRLAEEVVASLDARLRPECADLRP